MVNIKSYLKHKTGEWGWGAGCFLCVFCVFLKIDQLSSSRRRPFNRAILIPYKSALDPFLM